MITYKKFDTKFIDEVLKIYEKAGWLARKGDL